ncbi:MAG: hypothetical protein AAF547_12080, partial [Actinomycetota bacterium]
AVADAALAAAEASGSPTWIAWTKAGLGRAAGGSDPLRALAASREAADYAREQGIPFYEALNAREAAALEVIHGDIERGTAMYQATVETLHRAGATSHLSILFANLAAFFLANDRPEVGATLVGVAGRQAGSVSMAMDFSGTTDRLEAVLSKERFDQCLHDGATMSLDEAVELASGEIEALRATME